MLLTYERLNKGLLEETKKPMPDQLPDQKIIKMQQNLYKFSAAKSASMLQEMNSLLYENGKLISFDKFRKKLDKLNIAYNKNWLEAEYRTARQSGYMAQKWEAIMDNQDLFPNLKYKTQEDDRVRKEHEALNNIIAPINDPFWDKYYPPNGWRCRCDVIQTAEEASDNIPDIDPSIKPEFEMNIGKSGQVFKEEGDKHSFFALAEKGKDWKKRFELSKLEGGYNKVLSPKGNIVKVSIYADEADVVKNVSIAKIAYDQLNHRLDIMPHINLTDSKNPEFRDANGLLGDRISPKWKNIKTATENAFKDKLSKSKKGQLADLKNTFLIIEVDFKPTDENIKDFTRSSWSRFNHYKPLDYIILYRGGNAIKLERNIIKTGYDFYADKVNSLF